MPSDLHRACPLGGGLVGELAEQFAHGGVSDRPAVAQPVAAGHPGDIEVLDADDIEAAHQPARQLVEDELGVCLRLIQCRWSTPQANSTKVSACRLWRFLNRGKATFAPWRLPDRESEKLFSAAAALSSPVRNAWMDTSACHGCTSSRTSRHRAAGDSRDHDSAGVNASSHTPRARSSRRTSRLVAACSTARVRRPRPAAVSAAKASMGCSRSLRATRPPWAPTPRSVPILSQHTEGCGCDNIVTTRR